MPKYRVTWSSGVEEISASDEDAAMEFAMESVEFETLEIEDDDEAKDEEEK